MLTIPNEESFIQALEEGMTFLESCAYSGNDTRALSVMLKATPALMMKAKDAVRKSTKLYLDMAADEAKKGQLYRADKAREKAKEVEGKWVLWGDGGDIEEMTTDQVLRAYRRYGSVRETAMALGISEKEFDAYLEQNDLHDLLDRVLSKGNW